MQAKLKKIIDIDIFYLVNPMLFHIWEKSSRR